MLAAINTVGIYFLSAQTQGGASCPAEVGQEEKGLKYLSGKNPRRHGQRVDASALAKWRDQVNKSAGNLADHAAACGQLTVAKKDSLLTQAATAIIVALGNEKDQSARLATLTGLLHITVKMAAAGVPSATVTWALETADCLIDGLSAQKTPNLESFRGQIARIREKIKANR